MRRHGPVKRRIARERGCRLNYYDYSHDMTCGERRVILLPVQGGHAWITLQQYREARRRQPRVWLYDPRTGAILGEASWYELEHALQHGGRVAGFPVRLKAGRRGSRRLCVVLGEEEYRRLAGKARMQGLALEEYVRRLLRGVA